MSTGSLSHPVPEAAASVARRVCVAASAMFVAAAVLLIARRLSGAFWRPLDPLTLLLAGLTVAGGSNLVSHTAGACDGLTLRWPRLPLVLRIVALLLAGAVGLAIWTPNTPALGAVLFWSALAGGEIVGWRIAAPANRPGAQPARSGTPQAVPPPTPDAPPDDATQHFTRRQTRDGDVIDGWLRAEFSAGARTAVAHVAFCPPMAGVPEVAAEQVDGPPVQIKATHVYPYGARLELKLGRAAAQPLAVCVALWARAAARVERLDVV